MSVLQVFGKHRKEKEKFLVKSFSFLHSVFYLFRELSAIFIRFKLVVSNIFQFGSLKLVFWERANNEASLNMLKCISRLIVWCFQQYFSYIMVDSAPIHAFLEVPELRTIFFPSLWLLSHITSVETQESGDRGMNPVAITIINNWKEY